MDDTIKLDWDNRTGKPPKRGVTIQNTYGDKFKVVKSSGGKVELKRIMDK